MKEERLKPPFSRPLTGEELDALPDTAIDCGDIPSLGEEFWRTAQVVRPDERKKQVTLRLDPDMLEWFRAQGAGYQTRINAVLRSYYEAHVSK